MRRVLASTRGGPRVVPDRLGHATAALSSSLRKPSRQVRPRRRETELSPRLGVGCAALQGRAIREVLVPEHALGERRDVPRGRRSDKPRVERQPFLQRRRPIVADVEDAGRTAEGKHCGRGGVVDVYERCRAGTAAGDRIVAPAHERVDGAALVEGAAEPVERAIPQGDALDAWRLQHGALQFPQREDIELPGVGNVGAEVKGFPLGLHPAAPRRIDVRIALGDEAACARVARRLDQVARALDAHPPVGGELLDGVAGLELTRDGGELVDHDLGPLVGQQADGVARRRRRPLRRPERRGPQGRPRASRSGSCRPRRRRPRRAMGQAGAR